MSEGNCSLNCSYRWARGISPGGSAHVGCQLNGHSSCLSWGTKARQGASVCLFFCSPQDLQLGFAAGWQSWVAFPLHLLLPNAVLGDGLMSLLLPQRDAGSRDEAVRMAGCSAAGAANWNNAVTPSTSVKLLVIFECRVEAQWLQLGTAQWEKSRFSVCFHPVLAVVPLSLSRTAACCLK